MSTWPVLRAGGWVAQCGFALACVALVVLSVLPGEQIPQSLRFWDKAQHALGFAAVSVLAVWAQLRLQRWVPALLALGAAIEVLQGFLPWRFGDLNDWLADALGVVLVAWLARALTRGRPTTT